MNQAGSVPEITLRIPGAWAHPGELLERLPDGFRLTPDALILPDGREIAFFPMPPDDQFPEIFESSCRRAPREEELAVVARYSVNVGLCGPGGSLESARTMMQAAAAVVKAGAAGVFIDNSGLAHGGQDWIELTDDGGPEALSFAFASIVRSKQEVYTMGLHALGFADVSMHPADIDEDGETIIELIRYICGSGRPIDVGHILADERGPRFQIVGRTQDEFPTHSPMHNPFGRLKIVNAKEVAEGN